MNFQHRDVIRLVLAELGKGGRIFRTHELGDRAEIGALFPSEKGTTHYYARLGSMLSRDFNGDVKRVGAERWQLVGVRATGSSWRESV